MKRAAWSAEIVAVAASGARTGLPVGVEIDGGVDASTDGPHDARADVADAPPDAPLDAPIDAPSRIGCADAGIDYIYVLTSDEWLFSFDPPTSTFSRIGQLFCPGTTLTTNSMAVDRKGTAFVSFEDGSLFEVSTLTATCTATRFVTGQQGWGKYGMGFATNGMGPTETLYVAEASYQHPSKGLATIDTASFAFHVVGPWTNPLGNAVELTGRGDGKLFGFFLATPGPGGYLTGIDKATATITDVTPLPIGAMNAAFAFAAWGGDFYFFIAPNGNGTTTTVTRYHPPDGSLVDVATLPQAIVGAGVSTCAPQ
jgi:hypothetical protein